ncbi:hypothetical protein NA57DRAFT_17004, partial [Rhizodiscina lignyota]
QTLTPGGVATIHGTTVSLGPSASFIVVNGHTQTLSPAAITPPPVLLVAGTSFTANAGTTFTIDGQTLTPGGEITVDGTTVSLGTAANILYIIDGQTLTPGGIITVHGETISLSPRATVLVVDGRTT